MSRIAPAIAALTALTALTAVAAATPPARAPSLPPQVETFVLIATNNQSLEPGRPALRYADDDGARYYELFRTVTPAERIYLLTELDRDTAQLFPELTGVARPPSRVAIAEATGAIARDVAAARRAGRSTQLYVVYAGHGDLDGGRGYVELSDARFYSEDLERLLVTVGATRSHVILDSCNSFFVLNARKPGGRRFATPEDAARNLGVRLPGVGMFLSTSAEAEVFEWSALQSGIFSHAVRSGLAGGADANGDGAVSYEELAAFVGVATAGVRNVAYRPKVFARGPHGDDTAPLWVASPRRSVGLALGDAATPRLTIRDRLELPWADVYPEPGARLILRLPAERLADGAVDEHPAGVASGALRRRRSFGRPAPGELLRWSSLAPDDAEARSRGPGELFGAMFDRPFGPRALAAYQDARRREPVPVFGINAADAYELQQLLGLMRASVRRSRWLGGSWLVGMGVATAAFGAWHRDRDPANRAAGNALLGLGAVAALGGGLVLALPDRAERLAADFAAGVARGEDASQLVARTAERLEAIRRDYRRTRKLTFWAGIGIAAASAAGLAINELGDAPDRGSRRLVLGGFAALGAVAASASFLEHPIERVAAVWNAQSSVRRLAPSVQPLPGGAALGVSAGF